MARPAVHETTEILYDALGDGLTQDDESTDWQLLKFLDSGAGVIASIHDLVRDTEDGPGWSGLFDVDRTPHAFLEFLAQFIGVTFPEGLTDAEKRAYIEAHPRFDRGTLQALKDAIAAELIGTKRAMISERAGSPYRLDILTHPIDTVEVLAFDSFDRANSAVSLGSPDKGAAWSALSGTWGISSNRAYMPAANSSNQRAAVIDVGAEDFEIECEVFLSSTRAYIGLAFKHASATSFLATRISCDSANNTITLREITAATTGTLLVTGPKADFILGASYMLRVRVEGDRVRVWVDDVLQIDYTMTASQSAAFASSTSAGLFTRKDATTGNDDGTSRWENFTVSDLSGSVEDAILSQKPGGIALTYGASIIPTIQSSGEADPFASIDSWSGNIDDIDPAWVTL